VVRPMLTIPFERTNMMRSAFSYYILNKTRKVCAQFINIVCVCEPDYLIRVCTYCKYKYTLHSYLLLETHSYKLCFLSICNLFTNTISIAQF
jgi:hypothetical protein